MTKQEYVSGIVAKFNLNEQHPDLTPTERAALLRVKEIEQGIATMIDKADVLSKEIAAKDQEIRTLQTSVAKERGKVDGMIDMLALGAGAV